MHTLANLEDPDEMPRNAPFHQDLHYLLRHKQFSEKEIQILFMYLEIINCDPSIYTMSHSDFIASCFMEILIGLKMVKQLLFSGIEKQHNVLIRVP